MKKIISFFIMITLLLSTLQVTNAGYKTYEVYKTETTLSDIVVPEKKYKKSRFEFSNWKIIEIPCYDDESGIIHTNYTKDKDENYYFLKLENNWKTWVYKNWEKLYEVEIISKKEDRLEIYVSDKGDIYYYINGWKLFKNNQEIINLKWFNSFFWFENDIKISQNWEHFVFKIKKIIDGNNFEESLYLDWKLVKTYKNKSIWDIWFNNKNQLFYVVDWYINDAVDNAVIIENWIETKTNYKDISNFTILDNGNYAYLGEWEDIVINNVVVNSNNNIFGLKFNNDWSKYTYMQSNNSYIQSDDSYIQSDDSYYSEFRYFYNWREIYKGPSWNIKTHISKYWDIISYDRTGFRESNIFINYIELQQGYFIREDVHWNIYFIKEATKEEATEEEDETKLIAEKIGLDPEKEIFDYIGDNDYYSKDLISYSVVYSSDTKKWILFTSKLVKIDEEIILEREVEVNTNENISDEEKLYNMLYSQVLKIFHSCDYWKQWELIRKIESAYEKNENEIVWRILQNLKSIHWAEK